jgi:succinyl-CoA synthetase alpha subunit
VPVWNFVRRSFYRDSITLMRLTRDLESVAGVRRVAAMMGTPQNRALLAEAGLLAADGEAAAPADLVLAVVADDAAAAAAAREAADAALTAPPPPPAAGIARARSLRGALTALPDATLALVSVPGLYAGDEARRALAAGLHVMLFSDNVPVDTEVALKREAATRGLFVLGPDCGTALLHGVPLGFANAVPRGRIGLVASSGTGLQEVACLIAAGGEGVSHAIGVGSRDLSEAVGGAMSLPALRALGRDAATEVVAVVAKPASPAVASRLIDTLRALDRPSVLWMAGQPGAPGGSRPWIAATLEDAAAAAVALARAEVPRTLEFTRSAPEIEALVASAAATLRPGQRFVRGLYAGGTLAWEAAGLLAARLEGVAAGVDGTGDGHRVVDLGADVFTVGRPHPMIDGSVRRDWIAREARDPGTAVLLLDVVLGHGAHRDPAGELAPALRVAQASAAAAGRGLAIVASVTGTEADPQGRSRQAAALAAAGAIVMGSNAQAARLAALVAARAGAGGA